MFTDYTASTEGYETVTMTIKEKKLTLQQRVENLEKYLPTGTYTAISCSHPGCVQLVHILEYYLAKASRWYCPSHLPTPNRPLQPWDVITWAFIIGIILGIGFTLGRLF